MKLLLVSWIKTVYQNWGDKNGQKICSLLTLEYFVDCRVFLLLLLYDWVGKRFLLWFYFLKFEIFVLKLSLVFLKLSFGLPTIRFVCILFTPMKPGRHLQNKSQIRHQWSVQLYTVPAKEFCFCLGFVDRWSQPSLLHEISLEFVWTEKQ